MSGKQFFYVSEYNLQKEVMWQFKPPDQLKIYDTTLRDGEQTIGVAFDKLDKMKIAQALDDLGVQRIEAGMPVVSAEDKIAVEAILNMGLKAEIWGFCRAVKKDVRTCMEIGVKHLICEIATSDIKMRANGFTKEKVLRRLVDCLQFAKKNNIYVAFFAVDATRTKLDFLKEAYLTAVNEGGADEVVVVDTLGVATPETMFFLTRKVKQWVDVPVMTHCHNDFGMGVACTLSSVKAGAEYAQVTMNGLGEKTGNADLAEVAIAAQLYGIPVAVDMKKLFPVAQLVENITKIPLSPLKPVTGKNVFIKESGVTVAQVITYPPSVEGFSPEILGRERGIVLGKKSGKKSINYKLKAFGLNATDEQIDGILAEVKALGLEKKGLVSDDEFKKIVSKKIKLNK